MKKYKTLFFLLLCSLSLWGQQSTLLGHWEGIITQKEGGYRTSYDFRMTIGLEGDRLTGVSYVSVDSINARMQFSGKLERGNRLYFEETAILRAVKMEGMDWCLKQGRLRLIKRAGQWCLEGTWEGASSLGACIPGRILLRKAIPKA